MGKLNPDSLVKKIEINTSNDGGYPNHAYLKIKTSDGKIIFHNVFSIDRNGIENKTLKSMIINLQEMINIIYKEMGVDNFKEENKNE